MGKRRRRRKRENREVYKLLKKIKLNTKRPELYKKALTHSSYAHEHNIENNERLEYLGDAVLEVFMSEYLYENEQHFDEGFMTKRRAQLVCEEALYAYATKIQLQDYLLLGKGEKQKGASQAVVADAFEALIGAIYVDKGFETARKYVRKLVVPNINLTIGIKDYKTQLQEFVQVDKRTLSYQIIEESGPSHDKVFEAAVYLDGKIILGTGKGKSKKEAEQKAAKQALKKGEFNA